MRQGVLWKLHMREDSQSGDQLEKRQQDHGCVSASVLLPCSIRYRRCVVVAEVSSLRFWYNQAAYTPVVGHCIAVEGD